MVKLLTTLGIALLALAPSAIAPPAAAQQVFAQMACAGSFQTTRFQGTVRAEIWRFQGGTSFRSITPYLMRGQLHRIPGTVVLRGILRDSNGQLVSFEVAMKNNGQGVGSFWINHQRHRESHMRLVIQAGGFIIYPETGGAAQFTCRQT